jgi:hypothetical protein
MLTKTPKTARARTQASTTKKLSEIRDHLAGQAFCDWMHRAGELVQHHMDENDLADRDLLNIFELDDSNEKHWQLCILLRALATKVFYPIRHTRGRPRGSRKWSTYTLLEIGAAVERYLQQRPGDPRWEEVAEHIRREFKHKVKGMPDAKTLRKRLPEALRLHRLKEDERRRQLDFVVRATRPRLKEDEHRQMVDWALWATSESPSRGPEPPLPPRLLSR